LRSTNHKCTHASFYPNTTYSADVEDMEYFDGVIF
jgi:hypothetical protein